MKTRFFDIFSLVDITDDLLDLLMELVYQLLCDGELMLAKLLRGKVLGKHEHRRINQPDTISKPLADLDISSK